jgi:hypothetical protein
VLAPRAIHTAGTPEPFHHALGHRKADVGHPTVTANSGAIVGNTDIHKRRGWLAADQLHLCRKRDKANTAGRMNRLRGVLQRV